MTLANCMLSVDDPNTHLACSHRLALSGFLWFLGCRTHHVIMLVIFHAYDKEPSPAVSIFASHRTQSGVYYATYYSTYRLSRRQSAAITSNCTWPVHVCTVVAFCAICYITATWHRTPSEREYWNSLEQPFRRPKGHRLSQIQYIVFGHRAIIVESVMSKRPAHSSIYWLASGRAH